MSVKAALGFVAKGIVKLLLVAIRVYQVTLSPLLGPVCRFEPSCSRYAAQSLARHGLAKGGWLAIKRLSKCHPFHPGGYDPVPGTAKRDDEHGAHVP